MFKEINKCRICQNKNLVPVLNLGKQCLTSIFPKDPKQRIKSCPLKLVKCEEDGNGRNCGLLQLKHNFNRNEIYGDSYGYRSGINWTMTAHLQGIVKEALNLARLHPKDIILDIGSNDGTLLKAYPQRRFSLLGIDPSGKKFKKYYPKHINLATEYFSESAFRQFYGNKKAKIITSIAMFYDLDSPLDFMSDISEILADDGIWMLEQSYMPLMLKQNSYDTICHEHLEYYGFHQIRWMTDKIGLKIIDASLNKINGGSFRVTVTKKTSKYRTNSKAINTLLKSEKIKQLDKLNPFVAFKKRTLRHKDKLIQCIGNIKKHGQAIGGYGASTKGNVILQFCDFNKQDILFIADRNSEKYGCFTPGSRIPIVSEEEARRKNPAYLLEI